MGAGAQSKDAAPGVIGKKELAAALGWSRPTLDKRLRTDALFPVRSRGDQSGGWAFDLAAVRAYLAGAPVAVPGPATSVKAKGPAIDRAQLRDAVAPPRPAPPVAARRSAHHLGEATARQRKDAADAALKENKLALENGELVRAADISQILTEVFAAFGQKLDAMPEEIVKRRDLPEEAAADLRKLIDEARTALVRDALAAIAAR